MHRAIKAGDLTFLGVAFALMIAMAAVSYVLVHQSLSYLSEVLYTPVILMVAISLVDAIRQPTRGRLAWAGVWLGISWLVRPTLLLFPVAALLLFRATLGRPAVLDAGDRWDRGARPLRHERRRAELGVARDRQRIGRHHERCQRDRLRSGAQCP